MVETREVLEAQKRELFDAIRTLDRDREDGSIDEAAYRVARLRYEAEAAQVIERIDRLSSDAPVAEPAASGPPWLPWVAASVVLAALLLFLVGALHQRTGNQSVSGDAPTVVPQVSAVQLAARQAAAHPHSAQAQLALGNAYLNAGQAARADRAYRTAIRLNPRDPAGPTLHAMALGTEGKPEDALSQLRTVERLHPSYARAWLLDGLIASRRPRGDARARRAWTEFLRLQPHGAVSGNVRLWLKELK